MMSQEQEQYQTQQDSESEDSTPMPELVKPKLKKEKKVELDENGNVIKKPRTEAQIAALVKCREGHGKWAEEKKRLAKEQAEKVLDTMIKVEGCETPQHVPPSIPKKPRKKKVQIAEAVVESKTTKEEEKTPDWKAISQGLAYAYAHQRQDQGLDFDDSDIIEEVEEKPKRKKSVVAEDDDEEYEEKRPKKARRELLQEERFQRHFYKPVIQWL